MEAEAEELVHPELILVPGRKQRPLLPELRASKTVSRACAEPEHALSHPTHYNAGLILAPCAPRLQFPYRIYQGRSATLTTRGLLQSRFGIL
jgi:hypothetical protein